MLRLLEEVGEITYHSFKLDEVDVFPDQLTCNCEEKAIISYIFTDDSRISLTLINQAITVDLIQVLGKLVSTKNKKIGKDVALNIVEVKDVDLAATLVAESIANQLERRISFRKAMKQAMQKTMKAGALGIKTAVSGRLGGAEIARTEHYSEGTIPLQTLRADIDYGFAEAKTTYGIIGVKVWIYKGDVLPAKKQEKGGN